MSLQDQLLLETHRAVQAVNTKVFDVERSLGCLQTRVDYLASQIDKVEVQLDNAIAKSSEYTHALELKIAQLESQRKNPDINFFNNQSSGGTNQLNQGENHDGGKQR